MFFKEFLNAYRYISFHSHDDESKDFALVVRNALCHSRRCALSTQSVLVCIFIHCIYFNAHLIYLENNTFIFESIYKSFQKQSTLNLNHQPRGFLSNLQNNAFIYRHKLSMYGAIIVVII